jgi:DNA polymerase-3 subunit alpha
MDMNNTEIYENIFHKGKWAGVFQFTEQGAQQFCVRAKPNNIIDVSAITSIFRPGPLSAGVDADYVEAKGHPHSALAILSRRGARTHRRDFWVLIFQEQIALLAHKLGGLTLDEGNMLRKVLDQEGNRQGVC